MRFHSIVIALLFSIVSKAQIQEIKIVDQYILPIQGVEVVTSKVVLGLSNEHGIVPIAEKLNDSVMLVFIHQSYYTKTLSYAELKAQNFTVSLRELTSTITPIYVTAGRIPRLRNDVALSIDMVSKTEFELHQPQTAADLIGLGNKVFIQKSQMGGGSPMIRGFATNRILLVVDDIRMNTAIFRSGNVHNIISIDPYSIEEAETIFGPASQFYGSDAIGGVLSFKTKSVQFSKGDSTAHEGNMALKYASVNSERTFHLDMNNAGKHWGSFSSFTLSQFGDLMMGSNGPDFYTQDIVALPNDGGDTIVNNNNANMQRFTGYNQISLLQKIEYKKKNIHLGYGLSFSNIPENPRYDRLILTSSPDTPRYAEWYYGPQYWMMNRFFLSYMKEHLLFDYLRFNTAHQKFKESRIDRRLFNSTRRVRSEEVDAYSVNLDLEKRLKKQARINYGIEYVYNSIGSKGYSDSLGFSERTPVSSRYPDGSSWYAAGVYANYFKRFKPIYTIEAGIRYNYYGVRGELDTSFYPFPVTSIDNNKSGLTFSFAQNLKSFGWHFGMIASTAYRAPNIDDISKVFDSNQGAVVIPNTQLQAEYAYNLEVNAESPTWNGLKLMVSAFYTLLDQAIVLSEGELNGSDSILYDGVLSQVLQLKNTDQASVQGLQFDLRFTPDSLWTVKAHYTALQSSTKEGYPIRHITPNYGSLHIEYKKRSWILDLSSSFQQRFDSDQFSLSELTDSYLYLKNDKGLPYSPAWYTIDLHGGRTISNNVKVFAGIENILNRRYRPYSSGIVAPGRNFMISLRGRF